LGGAAPTAILPPISDPTLAEDRSMAQSTSDATERVQISCPGCGRHDYVTWPVNAPTYHWKCFNCHKKYDLQRKGGGH